ncbi:MAG: hypothetical protein HPY74_19565 [Firmicutes bacterium]|nr:hypothetical protein [Bacillota bacterium]
MRFKKWLQRKAGEELREHAKRRLFPCGTDWREYKLYFNINSLSDEAIMEFDELWEQYWAEKAGEKYCRYMNLRNILKTLKKLATSIRADVRHMTIIKIRSR